MVHLTRWRRRARAFTRVRAMFTPTWSVASLSRLHDGGRSRVGGNGGVAGGVASHAREVDAPARALAVRQVGAQVGAARGGDVAAALVGEDVLGHHLVRVRVRVGVGVRVRVRVGVRI
eukprot:scaffold54253_cov57-Phaeocystis_antarctica.AAC.1